MVRRRAKKVSGAVIDENTGSSLYSRIGTTHMSIPCFRISGRKERVEPLLEPRLLLDGLLAKRAERPIGRRQGGRCDLGLRDDRERTEERDGVRRTAEQGVC